MAEAAIQGIGVHGLRWKHNISLGGQTEIMGTMNFDTPDADVAACANAIVRHVRATRHSAKRSPTMWILWRRWLIADWTRCGTP
jgi:hypothetical protein